MTEIPGRTAAVGICREGFLSGTVLILASAVLFAASIILARVGMRHRSQDNGVFMSILVNTVVFSVWIVMLHLGDRLPPLTWQVVGIFVLAGAVTSWGGRTCSMAANRLIGPSRSSAFKVISPVFAGVVGFLVLSEVPSRWDTLGGALALLGIWLLSRVSRSPDAGPDAVSGAVTPAPPRSALTRGILLSLGAAALYGMGFVVRRAGLNLYPSALMGAWISTATAMVLLVAGAAAGRQIPRLVADNFRALPGWFVLSGLASSGALVCQFAGLQMLPAAVASVLYSTEPLWAMVLGFLFLRREERLTAAAVMAVVLTVLGVGVMAVGQ